MDALFNIFSVQLRIGIFDKPNHNQLGPNNVGTEEHRELPVEAVTSTKKKKVEAVTVRQAAVLLKNDNKSSASEEKRRCTHVSVSGVHVCNNLMKLVKEHAVKIP